MRIKSSQPTPADVSAPTIVPFNRLADLPFNGYVEFALPDQVTIGGKAECFYTGDETTDFRIASTLAEILVDATNVAERAQFSFGIAGAAGGRARRLLRKSYLEQNPRRPTAHELAQTILESCRTLRP